MANLQESQLGIQGEDFCWQLFDLIIITTADLTNSLEDYAVYHLLRSTRRGGLAVIARKGLRVSQNAP